MADPAGADHSDHRLGKAGPARGGARRKGQGSV